MYAGGNGELSGNLHYIHRPFSGIGRGIPRTVNIIFNKADAYNEDELRYLNGLINLYTTIGYPCFKISAKTGEESTL